MLETTASGNSRLACNHAPNDGREIIPPITSHERAQVQRCRYEREGLPCFSGGRLENMAAHFTEAHGAEIIGGPFLAQVLDDGSKIVRHTQVLPPFSRNSGAWFSCAGNSPFLFRTALGGCFAFDLQKVGPDELRFGVRRLGRGPLRHRLASVSVSFGAAGGTCIQFALSRALAADERLGDDALCAGVPPAVGRVTPALLAPTLARVLAASSPERRWELAVTFSLVFHMAGDV